MNPPIRHPAGAFGRVWLALAVLAFGVKLLVPAGFMVAPKVNDLPFAVVMCTGNGAVTVGPGQAFPGQRHHPTDGDRSHDSPCAFAGLAAVAPPPMLSTAEAPSFAVVEAETPAAPLGLSPGRGLSGPPLPARGPPSLSI